MDRYYHVAGEGWPDGGDLVCFAALLEAGRVTLDDWKWELADPLADGWEVCLYRTLAEAEQHRAEFGGAAIVVVEPDDLKVRTNSEGHLYVLGRVPAAYIVDVLR
jgi:hypothetical protein